MRYFFPQKVSETDQREFMNTFKDRQIANNLIANPLGGIEAERWNCANS